MTVEELHEVMLREFDGVNGRLDAINGRVRRSEDEISSLKVRAAYWAGGAVVAATIVGWIVK